MARFIVEALLAALVTIWIATIAVTLLIHLVPGDPVRIMYGSFQTTPEELEAIRVRLGLDQPIWTQYFMYLGRLSRATSAHSIVGDQPVLEILLTRFPATLALTVSSLAIAIVVGMSLGFLAAYKRGTWVDWRLMVLAIIGVSMPHFWLGLLLLFLFALTAQWLPVAGGDWKSLILPALTLGLANAAVLARLTRSAMIDIFDQDFVRTAAPRACRRRSCSTGMRCAPASCRSFRCWGCNSPISWAGPSWWKMSSPGTASAGLPSRRSSARLSADPGLHPVLCHGRRARLGRHRRGLCLP